MQVGKEYSVVVGRTTMHNVQPEDQDDYFLVKEYASEGATTIVASVHVSPRKSHETFEHIKIEISIPTDQSFVSPGVLLDTALDAIAAREDTYYGVSLVDYMFGPNSIKLLPKHSNMNTIKQEDRTPEHLLLVLKENEEHTYIMNILNAAKVLCASGHRDCTYVTQYSSGTTSWAREGDETGYGYKSIIVRPDGTFETYID